MARLAGRLLCAAWVVLGLWVPAGAAADGERRIVVETFAGPGAEGVRAQLIRAMDRQDGVVVVSEDEAREAASRLGVELGTEPGYAAVGSELRVHAFVGGMVARERRRVQATLRVREGATGTLVGEARIAGRRHAQLIKAVKRVAWRRIETVVMAAQAGEPGTDGRAMYDEAPPPADLSTTDIENAREDSLDPELFGDAERDAAEDEEVDAATRPQFRSEYSALDVSAGMMLMNRGFSYQDAASDSAKTRPYSLPLGPALALDVEWYPGAHFSNGVLAQLGLVGGIERSFLMNSAGPDGVSFDTTHSAWTIGTQLRIPIDQSRITLGAAFGNHEFAIEPAHPRDPAPDIATVSYQQARFGAGARVALGDLKLLIDAAYVLVLDPGQIDGAPFFPGASAQGVRGSLGASYPVGSGFEIRGDLDVRMYMLSFEPAEDGSMAASGALDRYVSATLGMAWTMEPDRRYLDNL